MQLPRLPHDPMALAEFYEEGLGTLGALCERTWHDRLEVVADARAASIWDSTDPLVELELRFTAGDATGPRDPRHEIFPGCPLTFRLAERLVPRPALLERAVLQLPEGAAQAPPADVARRLWEARQPGCSRWAMETPFQYSWHVSILALVRAEIQAIDQHWRLLRLAVSLPEGRPDGNLAAALGSLGVNTTPNVPVGWPVTQTEAWAGFLRQAIEQELAADLAGIRARQQQYLKRELDRIEDYFDHYERELRERQTRARADASRAKLDQRLDAARVERQRRREDQIARHEIRLIPHLDSLILIAEPAWKTRLSFVAAAKPENRDAVYLPRLRCWL